MIKNKTLAVLALVEILQEEYGVDHYYSLLEAGDTLAQFNGPSTVVFVPAPAIFSPTSTEDAPSHTLPLPTTPRLVGLQTVADFMSPKVFTIPVESTVQDAATYLTVSRATCLAAVKDDQFEGWLSEGDIIEYFPPIFYESELGRSLTREEQIQLKELRDERSKTPISEFLYRVGSVKRRLVYLFKEMSLKLAFQYFLSPASVGNMQHPYLRKIPVLSKDRKRVEGILGYWMIISKFLTANIRPNILVRDCMLSVSDPKYSPILDTEKISAVSLAARQQGWSHIVMVDSSGKFTGMTSIDKIKRVLDPDLHLMDSYPISSIMRPADECTRISADDALEKWLRIFADDDIGALPVVGADGKLEGLLNYVSVLRSYRDYLFPSG